MTRLLIELAWKTCALQPCADAADSELTHNMVCHTTWFVIFLARMLQAQLVTIVTAMQVLKCQSFCTSIPVCSKHGVRLRNPQVQHTRLAVASKEAKQRRLHSSEGEQPACTGAAVRSASLPITQQ